MKTMNAIEASAYLGVHKDTLCGLAKAGKIPGVKVGRAWIFLDEDLTQYLRSQYKKACDNMGTLWGSTQGTAHRIGGTSSASKASAYAKVLEQQTGKKLSRLRPGANASSGSRTASA